MPMCHSRDIPHLTSVHLKILMSYTVLRICTLQLEDDSGAQVSRGAQAEEDQYEMEVRAANIVSLPDSR